MHVASFYQVGAKSSQSSSSPLVSVGVSISVPFLLVTICVAQKGSVAR
jgi:hypothetical protein